MATTKNTTAATATAAKGKTAPAPVALAPQAPRYVMGGWPAKAMGGNTVRAYCYTVALALAKANGPAGFTLAQYASALAASAKGSNMRQPGSGWGTAAAPNGIAKQHANWFAHPAQGWLAPAVPAPAKAKAKVAAAPKVAPAAVPAPVAPAAVPTAQG